MAAKCGGVLQWNLKMFMVWHRLVCGDEAEHLILETFILNKASSIVMII